MGALPRSYESDSGDEDVLVTKWPQQSGSQSIMSIPHPPGQHGHEGIETTDSAAFLADARGPRPSRAKKILFSV
eukprot:scaffold170582_cov28-Attheya_sp.AAC.1